MANEKYYLTPEEHAARLEHIIDCREHGMTYQSIANGIVEAGFKYPVSKMRIMDLMERYRPDLMGNRRHLRQEREV